MDFFSMMHSQQIPGPAPVLPSLFSRLAPDRLRRGRGHGVHCPCPGGCWARPGVQLCIHGGGGVQGHEGDIQSVGECHEVRI